MTDIIYKKTRCKVIIPEDLKFPPGCIRNLMIEYNGDYIITNYKCIKKSSNLDILNFT